MDVKTRMTGKPTSDLRRLIACRNCPLPGGCRDRPGRWLMIAQKGEKLVAAVASVQFPDDFAVATSSAANKSLCRGACSHGFAARAVGASGRTVGCSRALDCSSHRRTTPSLSADRYSRRCRGPCRRAGDRSSLNVSCRCGYQAEGAPDAADRRLRQPHLARHAARAQ